MTGAEADAINARYGRKALAALEEALNDPGEMSLKTDDEVNALVRRRDQLRAVLGSAGTEATPPRAGGKLSGWTAIGQDND